MRYTKGGVTFTPYPIHDTFAIAKLNEDKAGVEINTPQGTVWTDKWVRQQIPGLNEWRNSRIEIDANKLPQSMTLANGTKYIAAAHASVSEVNFKWCLTAAASCFGLKRSMEARCQKGCPLWMKKVITSSPASMTDTFSLTT